MPPQLLHIAVTALWTVSAMLRCCVVLAMQPLTGWMAGGTNGRTAIGESSQIPPPLPPACSPFQAEEVLRHYIQYLMAARKKLPDSSASTTGGLDKQVPRPPPAAIT